MAADNPSSSLGRSGRTAVGRKDIFRSMTAARDVPQKRIRLVAEATCRFADGATHRLWASRLSPSGAWILAVEPPRVGDLIELSLVRSATRSAPIKACVVPGSNRLAVAEKTDSRFRSWRR